MKDAWAAHNAFKRDYPALFELKGYSFGTFLKAVWAREKEMVEAAREHVREQQRIEAALQANPQTALEIEAIDNEIFMLNMADSPWQHSKKIGALTVKRMELMDALVA